VIVEVASKRRRTPFPADVAVVDVTSRGPEPWVRLSPFYPHGGIPVPLSPGEVGTSVEGIWQALKVFAGADVDVSKLTLARMSGLKRTVRRFGPVLGHRDGLRGSGLLDYETARRRIYLPAYRWVLDNCVSDVLEELRELGAERPLVLLDYTTNGDVANLATPLSHAALVARYLTGRWDDSLANRRFL